VTGTGPGWELAGPPPGLGGRGGKWPVAAPADDPAAEQAGTGPVTTGPASTGPASNGPASSALVNSGERRPITLTGRGAIAGMLVLFVVTLLVASWLQWGVLAGASFVIGSVAAAWYTRPRDLLAIAVSPPLLFFCALVVVKALTAQGAAIISTVEGTALTLANVAPWLFAGVVLYLIVAWVRGLPRCVRELRHDLRPDLPRPRSESPGATVSQGGYRPGRRSSR
jgi:Domain of unknown function (DUF6542)